MIHQVSDIRQAVDEIQTTLDKWRAKALYVVLIVVAVAGLPAYVTPLINANRITPHLWVYLVVYLAFVGLAVMPRLDVRLRGWAFVLLGYANAIARVQEFTAWFRALEGQPAEVRIACNGDSRPDES